MKKLTITTLILSTVFSTAVLAGHNSHYDYARVVDVNPIYERVSHWERGRDCEHKDHRPHKRSGHHSAVPAVMGGIVGGAVGHAIGHNKSNKQVGLVAGAALGAAIGAELGAQHHRPERNGQCEQRHPRKHRRELKGYEVTYRYHGHTYHTRTKYHPGRRIKIRVSVEPVKGHRHDKGRHSSKKLTKPFH